MTYRGLIAVKIDIVVVIEFNYLPRFLYLILCLLVVYVPMCHPRHVFDIHTLPTVIVGRGWTIFGKS